MRILSGIQPSGKLHLGNYFGMMLPALALQDKGEAFYFIADLHALTTVRNPAALRAHTRDLAVDFLACGLDPAKTTFFRQSDVPAHTELAQILSCITPMRLLERCHAFKDKTAKGLPASHGLFSYPVLMAADILLYDADLVPVGKDQKQHLEVTRDLAVKINEAYGKGTLKLPEPLIQETTAAVIGLDGAKMSKSYENTIDIFEAEKSLKNKIMGIATDATPIEAPKSTNSPILELYRLVASPADYIQMESEFQNGGTGYGEFKKRLLGAIQDYFAPMRERRNALLENPTQVDQILAAGAAKANALANQTLTRVKTAVGLL